LEMLYAEWSENGLCGCAEELNGLMLYMGEEVSLGGGGADVAGIMRGVAADGRLLLEVGGEERLFAAGDLTMRRRSP
jgi:biotin-(acetyl-CoA carboxylase) ligase